MGEETAAARTSSALGRTLGHLADAGLAAAEWPLRRFRSVAGSQLFILGLPRTGTTLVYQYLVHRLHVAYFTNGVGSYPTAPCLVTFLQHRLHGDYRSDFRSRYGKVEGAVAPREAGGFWGRFFGFEDYVRFDQIRPRDVVTLRRTVACVQAIFAGMPFVNKNVKHLLRLDALAGIFPESRFLIVERDLADVGLSILRARRADLEQPTRWWSVRPPDYDDLRGLPPAEQVAGQIRSLRARLDRDLSALPPDRVLTLDYAQFCRRPERLVEALTPLLGVVPQKNPPVTAFQRVTHTPTTAEEERLLTLLSRASLQSS